MALTQATESPFPYISVTIHVRGQTISAEALLDTGFDGVIAVPTGSLAALGRPSLYRRWSLADGSQVVTPTCVGEVQIAGHERFPAAITELGSEVLVGVRAIRQFRVVLGRGKSVTVEV